MNYDTLQELVCGRISDLVDQLAYYYHQGNEVMVAVIQEEIHDLKDAANADDYDFLYINDLRYTS